MAEKIVKDSQGLVKELVNDCISRHGVSAWLANRGYRGLANKVMDEDRFPSAQPERKRGKWIPHSEKCREYIGTVLVNVEYDYWLCDACGYRVEKGQPMYNFCPNCGADMRGEQDE